MSRQAIVSVAIIGLILQPVNMALAASWSTYSYDQNSNRVIERSSTGTTITYPSNTFETTGTTSTDYVYLPLPNGESLAATATNNGNTTSINYDYTDHLNSVNITTDQTGTPNETLDYYPYGSPRISVGINTSDKQYIGQHYDGDTGLSYLNARYYDGSNGKFVSEDSMFWTPEKILSDPQSQNSYSYGRNSPIVKTDPNGKFWFIAPTLAGAAIGGVIGGATAAITGNSISQGAEYGAISGAVAGFTLSTGVSAGLAIGLTSSESLIGSSALGNALGGVAGRFSVGQSTSTGDVALDTVTGAAGGIIGSANFGSNTDTSIFNTEVRQYDSSIYKGSINLKPTLDKIKNGDLQARIDPITQEFKYYLNREGHAGLDYSNGNKYLEYNVINSGAPKNTAERILIGTQKRDMHYSGDHYKTLVGVEK